jgi:tetratricopeptide (TPR) repeat protein
MQMERNNYEFSCRNRFYYGRELMYDKLNDCAINQFHKCIDSTENNRLDKYNACNKLFEIKDPDAINYFFKLLGDGIYRKDMFYYVAKYYFDLKNIEVARLYYILCISCNEPSPGLSFGYNKICHINSLLQLNIIEYKLGNINKAIDYNNKVLELDPTNKPALDNVIFYKRYENNTNK